MTPLRSYFIAPDESSANKLVAALNAAGYTETAMMPPNEDAPHWAVVATTVTDPAHRNQPVAVETTDSNAEISGTSNVAAGCEHALVTDAKADQRDCDEPRLSGLLDEEAEALVKYWAEESVDAYYFRFLCACSGGEWRRRVLAHSRIDRIAELVGRERTDKWFHEGAERYISRQDPTLWQMYRDGIEPPRDERGIALKTDSMYWRLRRWWFAFLRFVRRERFTASGEYKGWTLL